MMLWISSLGKIVTFNWTQNGSISAVRQISTAAFPLQFKATPALWAEPLKRKKRVDPMIIKAREEKKKRKLEKQLRRLQKLDRQYKPIEEVEPPGCLLNNLQERTRPKVEISEEVSEERIKMLKNWTRINYRRTAEDTKLLNRLIYSQKKALDELKLESEELYQAAVQIDANLLPFQFSGPSQTPPNKEYPTPDGDYIDISRKWM